MNNIENSIIIGGVNLMYTYLKGIIRMQSDAEKKRKSISQLFDECEERILNLEIASALRAQKETPINKLTLGWETDADAIERAKKLPPRGWVLPGLIPEGAFCNLQSSEKAGKSTLTKQIANDYAHNTDSMGLPEIASPIVQPHEAFLYDAELADNDILNRYEELGDTKVHRHPNTYFKTVDELTTHVRTSIEGINANVLVVFDNSTTAKDGFTKSDVDKLRVEFQGLQKEFNDRGHWLTVIFVHHTTANTSGAKTSERAGSVEWGRIATLNLTLLHSNIDTDYRALKVINSRGKSSLLSAGEVAVLRLTDSPYLHFEFERKTKETEVCGKKKPSSNQSSINVAPLDRKLTADEESYICGHYKPGEIGLGSLAKHILQDRCIEVTDKNRNQMKNVIQRYLKGKGLYEGAEK